MHIHLLFMTLLQASIAIGATEAAMPFCTQLMMSGKAPPKPYIYDFQHFKENCGKSSINQLASISAAQEVDNTKIKFLQLVTAQHLKELEQHHPKKLTKEQKEELINNTLTTVPKARQYMALSAKPKRIHLPGPARPVSSKDFEVTDQKLLLNSRFPPSDPLSKEERLKANETLSAALQNEFDQNILPYDAQKKVQLAFHSRYFSLTHSNPLLSYITKEKPNRADVEKAIDQLEKDFDKRISALSSTKIDRLNEKNTTLLFTMGSAVDQVAKDSPEYCWAYFELLNDSVKKHKSHELNRDIAGVGGAVACLFTGPYIPLCEIAVGIGINLDVARTLYNGYRTGTEITDAKPMTAEQRLQLSKDPEKIDSYEGVDQFNYLALVPMGAIGTAGRASTSGRVAIKGFEIAEQALPKSTVATKIAGRCISPEGLSCLDTIYFTEGTFSKVSTHNGWTIQQKEYLQKALTEIQAAKAAAAQKGTSLTKKDLEKWFNKAGEDPLQPFRLRTTSVFNEQVTATEIAKELKNSSAKLERVIPIQKTISSENHLYNYTRLENGKTVTYQIFTCAVPQGCTAGGKAFKQGEVTSIFPCGPNVKMIPAFSDATKTILQSNRPLNAETLLKAGSQCIQ